MKTPEFATDNKVGRKNPENVPKINVRKINGRTPDEIKKGLKKCSTGASVCDGCEFSNDNAEKWRKLMGDALAYIQQLESRLAQVERERDAAVVANSNAKHYIQYGLQKLENWDYHIKKRVVGEENAVTYE